MNVSLGVLKSAPEAGGAAPEIGAQYLNWCVHQLLRPLLPRRLARLLAARGLLAHLACRAARLAHQTCLLLPGPT